MPGEKKYGKPVVEPEHEMREREYYQALREFEQHALYDQPIPLQRMLKLAEDFAKKFPDRDHHPLVEFYLGEAWHREANAYRTHFIQDIGRMIAGRRVSVKRIKPEEIQDAYRRFRERAKLEEAEENALTYYLSSASKGWRGAYNIGHEQAMVLALDLQYRMATYRLSDPKKTEAQHELNHRLQELIQVIPGKDLEYAGVRREMELLYLLRTWMLNKGLSHSMSIEHGLPSEDLGKNKVDLRLVARADIFPLQLKAVSDDTYRTEFNEKFLAASRAKLHGTDTELAAVTVDPIVRGFKLALNPPEPSDRRRWMEAIRMKSWVLDDLSRSVPDLRKFIAYLYEQRPKKKGEQPLTREFILANTPVALLRKFGLLPEVGTPTMDQIRAAKKLLEPHIDAVIEIFGGTPEYLEPAPDQIDDLHDCLLQEAEEPAASSA